MKKLLLIGIVGLSSMLVGCSEPEQLSQQQFELKKLQMEQQHELDMAKIANTPVNQPQQVATTATPSYQEQEQQGYGYEPAPTTEESSGLGSAALGAVAGLAAGYAMSELLDDGYRSYTNSNGQSVYYDRNGRQIDRNAYDAYKRKNPTRHKIS